MASGPFTLAQLSQVVGLKLEDVRFYRDCADREHLFTETDIPVLKGLVKGRLDFDYTLRNGKAARSREAMYMESLAKLDPFNKNALDIAVESGLHDGPWS